MNLADDTGIGELDIVFVDVQTTGMTPAKGRVIEFGFARVGAEPTVTTICHGPDFEIPNKIRTLTGLDEAALADGLSPAEAWHAFRSHLRPQSLVMAHYLVFERRFLDAWQEGYGNNTPEKGPWDRASVCTYELVRRLLPTLPRKGLSPAAGFLGYPSKRLKRSSHHLQAQMFVWQALQPYLRDAGVHTIGDLQALLSTPAPKAEKKRAHLLPREKRLSLPKQPGVYLFKGKPGNTLYVGKARQLRRRVNSYFQKKKTALHTSAMIQQIHDVEVRVCASALHAAMLESDLIKAENTPYNEALRNEGSCVGFVEASSPDVFRSLMTPGGLPIRGGRPDRWWPLAMRLGAPADGDVQGWAELFDPAIPKTLVSAALETFLGVDTIPHGSALWVERKESAGQEDEEEPEESTTAAFEWTEDNVRTLLASYTVRAAHLLRRGYWFRALLGATIRWTSPDTGEVCTFVVQEALAPEALVRDYDRLRVVTTELKRLVKEAPDLRVTTSRWTADANALAQLLYWV